MAGQTNALPIPNAATKSTEVKPDPKGTDEETDNGQMTLEW